MYRKLLLQEVIVPTLLIFKTELIPAVIKLPAQITFLKTQLGL